MDWQLAITLGAITLAGSYFIWCGTHAWQNTKAGSCAGGCGCAKSNEQKSAALIPAEQLTMRLKQKR
jgi:hypothetical protein